MKIISTKKSVEQILKLHAEILDAVRTSLPKAIKIGELLTGIKDKMEHGQWLPWVQKNLPFAERTVRNYCRCFAERDKLKSANVADLSGAYILLSEPKTEPAPLPPMDLGRAAKAAELDAQIIKSIADVKTTATDFADGELPPGFIAREGFEAFIKSRGQSLDMTLTPADKDGLNVIILYLAAGAVISRETILECLRQFNPAREMELAA